MQYCRLVQKTIGDLRVQIVEGFARDPNRPLFTRSFADIGMADRSMPFVEMQMGKGQLEALLIAQESLGALLKNTRGEDSTNTVMLGPSERNAIKEFITAAELTVGMEINESNRGSSQFYRLPVGRAKNPESDPIAHHFWEARSMIQSILENAYRNGGRANKNEVVRLRRQLDSLRDPLESLIVASMRIIPDLSTLTVNEGEIRLSNYQSSRLRVLVQSLKGRLDRIVEDEGQNYVLDQSTSINGRKYTESEIRAIVAKIDRLVNRQRAEDLTDLDQYLRELLDLPKISQ